MKKKKNVKIFFKKKSLHILEVYARVFNQVSPRGVNVILLSVILSSMMLLHLKVKLVRIMSNLLLTIVQLQIVNRDWEVYKYCQH